METKNNNLTTLDLVDEMNKIRCQVTSLCVMCSEYIDSRVEDPTRDYIAEILGIILEKVDELDNLSLELGLNYQKN